jgi:hypothetical protein
MKRIVFCISVLVYFHLFQISQIGMAETEQIDKREALSQTVFVLEKRLPDIPAELMVYKIVDPQVTEDMVKKLMSAFNIDGKIIDSGKVFSVREGTKELVYWKAKGTGYIRFGDEAGLFENTHKRKLPSENEAEEMAERFLKGANLLPQNAFKIGTGYIELRQFDTSKQEKLKEIKNGIQVGFGVKIDGVIVEGPGAKASVILGENGKIIGAYKMWRDIKPFKKMKIITPEEAFKLFKKRWPPEVSPGQEGQAKVNVSVKVKEVYTTYYAYPAPEPMDYLNPVYVFKGEYLRSGVLKEKEVKSVDSFKLIVPAIPGDERIPWSK